MAYAISLVEPESKQPYVLKNPLLIDGLPIYDIPYSYPSIKKTEIHFSPAVHDLIGVFDFKDLGNQKAVDTIPLLEDIIIRTKSEDSEIWEEEPDHSNSNEEMANYTCKIFLDWAKQFPQGVWQVGR